MGRLTTHVLDLTRGRPAAGMNIELWRVLEQLSKAGVGFSAFMPIGKVSS
mgnify:CR=1 FL=1